MTIPQSFTLTATSLLACLTCADASTHRVELVYTPHDHWPLPYLNRKNVDTLQISALDSSFNPPTPAHLALARASPPDHMITTGTYDARLLLLSVRNADKILKQGDATYLQRLEMMYLLAKDIEPLPHSGERPEDGHGHQNIAIAIIDEPTFIGKSTALLAFLRSRLASFRHLCPLPIPKLTFVMGTDTLERLFSPYYYLPSQSEECMLTSLRYFFIEEGSTVLCAWRDPSSYPPLQSHVQAQVAYEDQLKIESRVPKLAEEFLLTNQIMLIDIGQAYSSSQVRRERLLMGSSESGSSLAVGELEGWKKLVSSRSVGKYIEERKMYLE